MKELIDILKNNMEIDRKGSLQPETCVYVWQQAIGAVQTYFENKKVTDYRQGNQVSFDEMVEDRIEKIRSILNAKAKDYASKTDRFHNFRVAARMNRTTPERALKGMMLKHEVSVSDMIENPHVLSEEMINEKIGDNINYLILLEGLLKERLNE